MRCPVQAIPDTISISNETIQTQITVMNHRKTDYDFNMLRAMEVFMAVADMKQVTAAAKALGMTQSAASQQLKNLETSFAVALLDRSVRPVALTHAGEVLHRRAFRILSEVEDLKSEFRRMKSAAIPVLRMGLLASIATTLTPALSMFVSTQLAIPELALSAGLATDHQIALNSRKIDIAVTSEPLFDMNGFDSIPLLQEPFYLILPESYTGSADNINALAKDLQFVRFGSDTPVGRRTDQHLQRLRLALPRGMEADRSSMVVAGVATGRGFAILTPSLLIDAVVEGMKLRIEPLPFAGFSRSILLVWRIAEMGTIPEMLATHCCDILRDHFEKILPDQAAAIKYQRGGIV